RKRALRGGTIVMPKDAYTSRVIPTIHHVAVAIEGGGGNWGDITFPGVRKPSREAFYCGNLFPQDEIIWKENPRIDLGKGKDNLNIEPKDASGIVPEGSDISLCGNTGHGATFWIGKDKHIAVPRHSASGVPAW